MGHIWEDETGLGADEVVETGEVDPDFVDPAKEAIEKEKASRPSKGAGKSGKGSGKASGLVSSTRFAPVGKSISKGSSKSKGGSKGKKRGPQHRLPRTRISAEKFT